MKAAYAYEARRPKELSISKGEVLNLLNNKDPKWWKVSREAGDAEGSERKKKHKKEKRKR